MASFRDIPDVVKVTYIEGEVFCLLDRDLMVVDSVENVNEAVDIAEVVLVGEDV